MKELTAKNVLFALAFGLTVSMVSVIGAQWIVWLLDQVKEVLP